MSPKRAALMLALAVLLMAGGFALGRANVPEVGLATAVTTSPPPTTAPETTAAVTEAVTEPPGNVYPISHIIAGHCEQLGDLEVTLHGIVSRDSEWGYESINISVVEIHSDEPNFYQLIEGISTHQGHLRDEYGFSLDDWNQDGFVDLSLLIREGGALHNSPSYYWLWDGKQNCFVENVELAEASTISDIALDDSDPPRVLGFWQSSLSRSGYIYYDYIDGRFVATDKQELHLIDGEWVVVEETRVSYGD